MYIESQQNPRIKAWSALKVKKGRTAANEFLVEGSRLVEELLRSSLEVSAVLWDVGTDELPDAIADAALERGVPIFELSPGAFAAVSDTVTPQGVIAIAKLPMAPSTTSGGTNSTAHMPTHGILLDGVQDPGNVGTLIRSADAFGIEMVWCGSGTVDPYSPKVVRASMGGLFRVPVSSQASLDVIEQWTTAYPEGKVYVTTATTQEQCYEADFRQPCLLVIGSEAFGVSEDVRDKCTHEVRIPMVGMAESLNAAVAGAVLLYEVLRQRSTASND